MGADAASRGLRNPKDSMKSTWRSDYSQWGPIHWLVHLLNVQWRDVGKPIPVHQKTDKVPFMTEISCHRWVWTHALWPLAVHKLINWYTGQNMHPGWAVLFYSLAMQANSIHEIWVLRRLGHTYGYFDGDKHERDDVPDHAMLKVFISLMATTIIRPVFAVFLAYRRSQEPSLSIWLPLELGLYSVILDGWFYLYHRSCHELDSLWQYHRTHHLTKHPSPLLSSYADSEQEILELAVIPILTYTTLKLMGFPMGFYDWWVCHTYIIFTEAFGHSGVRVHGTTASTFNWAMRLTGTALSIEDHDLHHRKGWRNSYNYGKQTRVWDTLFGTCHERIEGYEANVDYDNQMWMPLY